MKKTNLITIAIVAIAVFLTSCGGSNFNEEEVSNLLFNYEKGILAGVDIGDNWDNIKTNHNPEFTVRDEKMSNGEMIYQLRKDHNDHNMIHVDFGLNDDKKVTVIEYNITLDISDITDLDFMYKFKNTIADLFTNKLFYAVTLDKTDIKQWQIQRKGKVYTVDLYSSENTDLKIGHINVDITPVK